MRTNNRIKNIVELYKRAFPNEYKLVCEAIEMRRRIMKDGVDMDEMNGTLKRPLFEIPEKLSASIISELDAEELEYFKTTEGARWFAKTFPEFSLVRNV